MSLAVGDGIETLEQLAALPIGARIGPHRTETGYTRVDGGHGWISSTGNPMPPENFSLGGHNKVLSLPVEPPALSGWMVVGTVLTTQAQFRDLPIGTVIRSTISHSVNHTKRGLDLWVSSPGGHQRRNRWFSPDSRHAIHSLPQGVLSQNGAQSMSVIQTMEQFDALAVGTTVTAQPSGTTWTKREEELWAGEGTTLRSRYFTTDVQQGRITVGVAPAAGQWYQDGYYGYLLIGHDTEQAEHWKAIQFYGDSFNNVISQQTFPGTLADPEWTTERVRGLGSAMVTERGQKESYALGRDNAVRESNDRQGKLTTVQAQLHQFVGEHSDMREEINTILAAVELQAAPVTLLVTVIANITESKRPDPEKTEVLKSMATLPARAERPVSLATPALISYQTEFKMPVAVEAGAGCACALVTRASGIEHLRQQGVALHSYERVTRWCAGDSCPNRPAEPATRAAEEDPF